MERIQNLLTQYDPLSVKQHGDKQHKNINTLVAIATVFALLALICTFVILVTHHSGEVHSVNSAISAWKKDDTANKLGEVQLRTKVMPFSVGVGINYLMELTNVEEEQFQQALDSSLKSELKDYDIGYYLFTGNTDQMFPTLMFNENEVPVGNGASKCIHIKWADINDAKTTANFHSLTHFPNCSGVDKMWPPSDPTTGVNVHSWFQREIEIKCSGNKCSKKCENKGGSWSIDAKRCYAYDIIDAICIIIDRLENDFGEVEWHYYGGCFEHGSPARYVSAIPGTTYEFEQVRIEVREEGDPYLTAVEVTHGDDVDFAKSYRILGFIAIGLFVCALVCAAIVFVQLRRLKSESYQPQQDSPRGP